MNEPLNGLDVKIKKSGFSLSITDFSTQSVKFVDPSKAITNYEYEVRKNEEKRNILILKPEYLSVFLTEFKNIMRYDKKTSNYINEKLKQEPNE